MVVGNIGIDKLRKCKRKLERLNKIMMKYVDFQAEGLIDSDTLKQMATISEINELITDVIYYIIDNQNEQKS